MNQPKPVNLRAICAEAIFAVLEQQKSLQEIFPETLAKTPEKDTAWVHEMIYGVMRHLPTLQFWLQQLLDKPLKSKQRIVEHLLLVGLYQLHFSRVPDHAAVAETVQACAALKQPQLKGLVNAIMRNFSRKNVAETQIEDERINLGLPKWLYRKLQQAYPAHLSAIAAEHKKIPPTWLRVNTSRINMDEFKEALKKQDIEYLEGHHAECLRLLSKQQIPSLPGFEEGFFSVQDAAPQLCAYYLAPENNDVVLDACAAPGGKTGHIVEYQPNIGKVIAVDSMGSRLQRMTDNLSRLGHMKNVSIIEGDASAPGDWNNNGLFDRILLDAPCSATGIIRRHPDILWLRKASDIDKLVLTQKEILSACWGILKPGGFLLYATCSILPEENSNQIAEFLRENDDAQTVALAADLSFERQIMPGEDEMDGFYFAKLQKLA